MKKIKKKLLILKYFYEEEKMSVFIMFVVIVIILIYIFTNNFAEIIPFGSELMIAVYDISIALWIGVILHYFLIFLPKFKKRKNAQRELNIIINNLVKLISLIIANYYSKEKLYEIRFHNSPRKYIFNNIDKISKYIAENLKLDDVIKFEWNKKKKITFLDEFKKTVKKFTTDYREIVLKYGDCLEENTLNNLEGIYRNYIFISFRECSGMLSQKDIHKIIIKKLLGNMYNIQKTADKINDFFK